MIPRTPTEFGVTLRTPKAAGQERFFALEQAVKLAIASDYYTAESVVDAAEQFASFLTPVDGQGGPGEDG